MPRMTGVHPGRRRHDAVSRRVCRIRRFRQAATAQRRYATGINTSGDLASQGVTLISRAPFDTVLDYLSQKRGSSCPRRRYRRTRHDLSKPPVSPKRRSRGHPPASRSKRTFTAMRDAAFLRIAARDKARREHIPSISAQPTGIDNTEEADHPR